MIKNKKGAGVEVITILAVVIAVLAIVGLGYYLQYSGNTKFLENILPNFGTEKPIIESIEVIRYDLYEDRVEYFDGEQWIAFTKGEKIFENKVVKEEGLKSDFRDNYYYDPKIRESFAINIPDFGNLKFISFSKVNEQAEYIAWYERRHTPLLMKLGDPFFVSRDQTGNTLGYYYIIDQKLYFSKTSGAQSEDTQVVDSPNSQKLITSFLIWRDSILKKPIEIHYFDKSGNAKSDWYCVTKYDNMYLAVDLNKPVDEKNLECNQDA